MFYYRITMRFLLFAFILFSSAINAHEIECYLPSLKDGDVLEKIIVKLNKGELSVIRRIMKRPYNIGREEKEVLYHNYSDPKETLETGKDIQWENPFSIILMNSQSENIVFSPDIIIVDWKEEKIKTGNAYQNKFNTRWKCISGNKGSVQNSVSFR